MKTENLIEKVITYNSTSEIKNIIYSNLENNFLLTRHTPSSNKLHFKQINPNTQIKNV